MGQLDGQVAVITGAGSGIGAACALRFAEEGASLVGLDISDDTREDWKRATELAPAHSFHIVDVRDRQQLEDAATAVRTQHERIDILVNSAGVGGGGPVHQIEPDEWDRVVDINLKGTFLASRAFLPAMLEQESGSIVNLASMEGLEGFPGGSAYNASKGGVVLLTKNMSIDYARKGIRVNALCPGFIETPLVSSVFDLESMQEIRDEIREAHQLGRFGQPREIANAALFLASEQASFVTGVALPVDGGFTAGHRFSTTKMMGLG